MHRIITNLKLRSLLAVLLMAFAVMSTTTSCITTEAIFIEDGEYDNADYSDSVNDDLEHNSEMDLDMEERY